MNIIKYSENDKTYSVQNAFNTSYNHHNNIIDDYNFEGEPR